MKKDTGEFIVVNVGILDDDFEYVSTEEGFECARKVAMAEAEESDTKVNVYKLVGFAEKTTATFEEV